MVTHVTMTWKQSNLKYMYSEHISLLSQESEQSCICVLGVSILELCWQCGKKQFFLLCKYVLNVFIVRDQLSFLDSAV